MTHLIKKNGSSDFYLYKHKHAGAPVLQDELLPLTVIWK